MNKKLIKTISVACGCTTICGVGIGGVVYSTFCGSFTKPIYEGTPLPDDVYDIDKTTGTLNGFREDIDWTDKKYADCDVMELPANIKICKAEAFNNKIPNNIHILDLSNLNELTEIQSLVFGTNKSITKLVMPSKIKSVGYEAFCNLINITKIYWDWYYISPGAFGNLWTFEGIKNDNSCTIYSLSKEGTIEEFKTFLSNFNESTGAESFSNWNIEKY